MLLHILGSDEAENPPLLNQGAANLAQRAFQQGESLGSGYGAIVPQVDRALYQVTGFDVEDQARSVLQMRQHRFQTGFAKIERQVFMPATSCNPLVWLRFATRACCNLILVLRFLPLFCALHTLSFKPC